MIGAMSDTHDRLDAVNKAISFFNSQEVTDVLHAGDLVSPFVAPLFSKLKAKLHFVWGNNEGDHDFIKVSFAGIGVSPLGDFAALQLGGKKIALLHGIHREIVDSLIESGHYDLIVRGHSHRAEIIEGETLVVNPGEVCGYLTGHQTVALIDLDKMHGQIVEL
ncbi:metallophosphoesterase [Chloroflexota bacterium]